MSQVPIPPVGVSAGHRHAGAPGFPVAERHLLLQTPGIGPRVLECLEAVGVRSFNDLSRKGVDHAVEVISRRMASTAWRNRRRALQRALEAWQGSVS